MEKRPGVAVQALGGQSWACPGPPEGHETLCQDHGVLLQQ